MSNLTPSDKKVIETIINRKFDPISDKIDKLQSNLNLNVPIEISIYNEDKDINEKFFITEETIRKMSEVMSINTRIYGEPERGFNFNSTINNEIVSEDYCIGDICGIYTLVIDKSKIGSFHTHPNQNKNLKPSINDLSIFQEQGLGCIGYLSLNKIICYTRKCKSDILKNDLLRGLEIEKPINTTNEERKEQNKLVNKLLMNFNIYYIPFKKPHESTIKLSKKEDIITEEEIHRCLHHFYSNIDYYGINLYYLSSYLRKYANTYQYISHKNIMYILNDLAKDKSDELKLQIENQLNNYVVPCINNIIEINIKKRE